MSKPRLVKDYDKLAPEIIEQIKLVYPLGYAHHLVTFKNSLGETRKGLPFETEDTSYLIRMSVDLAKSIIEADDDYDDGVLRSDIKMEYEDKYDDDEAFSKLNDNEDNDLGDEDNF